MTIRVTKSGYQCNKCNTGIYYEVTQVTRHFRLHVTRGYTQSSSSGDERKAAPALLSLSTAPPPAPRRRTAPSAAIPPHHAPSPLRHQLRPCALLIFAWMRLVGLRRPVRRPQDCSILGHERNDKLTDAWHARQGGKCAVPT